MGVITPVPWHQQWRQQEIFQGNSLVVTEQSLTALASHLCSNNGRETDRQRTDVLSLGTWAWLPSVQLRWLQAHGWTEMRMTNKGRSRPAPGMAVGQGLQPERLLAPKPSICPQAAVCARRNSFLLSLGISPGLWRQAVESASASFKTQNWLKAFWRVCRLVNSVTLVLIPVPGSHSAALQTQTSGAGRETFLTLQPCGPWLPRRYILTVGGLLATKRVSNAL